MPNKLASEMDLIVEDWVLDHDNHVKIRHDHEQWPLGQHTPTFIQIPLASFIMEESSKFIEKKFAQESRCVGEQFRGEVIKNWLTSGRFVFNALHQLELTEIGWKHYREQIKGGKHV